MLPNESLLDVLHFSDYNTLVEAGFVSAKFLHGIAKYVAELPCRHNFVVGFFTTYFNCKDVTIGARPKSFRYKPGNLASLDTACRDVAGMIEAHSVANLFFSENTWNMPGVGIVFDAAPALKFAEEVGLTSPEGSAIGSDSEAFMRNFAGMKSLRLLLDFAVFRQFNWTFLRHECARRLRLIKCSIPVMLDLRAHILREDINRSVEELVRDCVALRREIGEEALELDFSCNLRSAAFGLTVRY